MRRLAAGIFVTVGIFAVGGASANAQSFNCRYAHFPDEATICHQPALAGLDNELAAVFGQRTRQLSLAERKSLEKEEEGWVIARRRCGRNIGCIEQHYWSRIRQLSAMTADRANDRPHERVRPPEPQRSAQLPVAQPPRPRVPPVVSPSTTPEPATTINVPAAPTVSDSAVAASREPKRSGSTTAAPTIQWVDPTPQH